MHRQIVDSWAVCEALYAKTLGTQALDFLKGRDRQMLAELASHEAVVTLEKIKAILDDPSLNDPECFQKVEAVVDALSEAGIPTTRHDW